MNKRKGRKEEKKGRKEGKKGREEKVILEGGTYCRGCRKKEREPEEREGEGKKERRKGRKKPPPGRPPRRGGGSSPACLVSQTVQRPFQKCALSDPLEIWCSGLGSKQKVARSKARLQESKIF